MTLQQELLAALREWGVRRDDGLDEDTSLIASGALDSVALFNLSLWVEERCGGPVDPTSFDLAREWDTVRGVVAFIERVRAGQRSASVPHGVGAHEEPAGPPVAVDTDPGNHMRASRSARAAGYEILPLTPQYKDAVIALQKRLWSSSEAVNRAFFDWRYEESPFAAQPLIYVALKDGEVVATRALCGSLWEGGGSGARWTWYFADDLVVLPEHENQGLFARFTERIRSDLAARGQTIFLSLSALRVTRLQSLAGGARSLGPMRPVAHRPRLVAALDSMRDVAGRLPLVWRAAGSQLSGESATRVFDRLDAAGEQVRDGFLLSVAREPRAAQMADLVARLGHDGRFRHVRDAAFFAWRYRNPLHEYRVVFADRRGELAGYLVLERGTSDFANHRRLNIADWEAESPEVYELLLRTAIEWGRPADLVSWTETLGSVRRSCLERNGFEATDHGQTARGLPSVLIWPVGEFAAGQEPHVEGLPVLDLASWDLRMAYTSFA